MKKQIIVPLVSILLLGCTTKLLEAKKNNDCGFIIENNTEEKVAVETLGERGAVREKMFEISRRKKKLFKNMYNVVFELSSKPHYSRDDYMPFGQFRLAMCPDTQKTFYITDFMDNSGMVPEYFERKMKKSYMEEYPEESVIDY